MDDWNSVMLENRDDKEWWFKTIELHILVMPSIYFDKLRATDVFLILIFPDMVTLRWGRWWSTVSYGVQFQGCFARIISPQRTCNQKLAWTPIYCNVIIHSLDSYNILLRKIETFLDIVQGFGKAVKWPCYRTMSAWLKGLSRNVTSYLRYQMTGVVMGVVVEGEFESY